MIETAHIIEVLRPLEKELERFASGLLSVLADEMQICQGTFFVTGKDKDGLYLRYLCGYAYHREDAGTLRFRFGEGLPGQVAEDGKAMEYRQVPPGYMNVISGLGQSSPTSLVIHPLKHKQQVVGVMELASFQTMVPDHLGMLDELESYVGGVVFKHLAQEKKKARS
ncbi:MAG: GAF domain-containing protein [Bacteroidales bacterium]